MKNILIVTLLLISNFVYSQEEMDFDLPTDFFSGMFRSPSDKYLVAWSGSVKMSIKNEQGSEVSVVGGLNGFDEFLNTEFDILFIKYFRYNMKYGKTFKTTSDDKIWVASCGYNPYNNLTYKDVMNGGKAGYPSDITTEVWGENYSKKKSTTYPYKDPKTKETTVLTVTFQASSIFYYHKQPTSLEGKIKRLDEYNLCGEIKFSRLGPLQEFETETTVADNQFIFNNQLYRGDYSVQFIWEDGTIIDLENHIVYDPTSTPELDLEYELETFEGEIEGVVLDEETSEPIKNYKVILKPICEASNLPTKETKTDERGKYSFKKVPMGVYKIVVKGAEDTKIGVTDPNNKKVEPDEIFVKEAFFDVYLTYSSPVLAKVELVWRMVEVKFPDEDNPPQTLDPRSMMLLGDDVKLEDVKGTDGEQIKLPYQMFVPGMGKETFYGFPEDENGNPEIINIVRLAPKKHFYSFNVKLDEGSLNDFIIHQIGNQGIVVDFSFDLEGVVNALNPLPMQLDVSTMSDKEGNMLGTTNYRAYPIMFKSFKLTDPEIEKLTKGEELELNQTTSDGRGKVLLKFKPVLPKK